MEHLTVAFEQLGSDWHGGQMLVTNAISALRQVGGVRTYVLGNASAASAAYARTNGADGVVEYRPPARSSVTRITSAALIRWKSYNATLHKTLARSGVQALIGESVVWQLGSVASIGSFRIFSIAIGPELFDGQELAHE